MPWWGVLLTVVAVQLAFLLVWWLVTRNKGADASKELEDSTTKRLQEELASEKKKAETIAAEYSNLTAKFKELAVWYNENKDQISKEAADAFKNMAGNPEAIDDWLNSLISDRTTSDESGTTNTTDTETT